MVKADIKHNYYADLELPTTCSIDDIKKQYRKLALLYHPDRNAGKEEEYVPKFQAIQTAHEVLGDAAQKAKYDADRRKAGLYPGAGLRTGQPTTGNPYTASSAYPPPPRRTQPGTWQRPAPATPNAAPQTPGSAPSGADRFSNFPRGAPTARKDPAQDRTNMFRAWQNMNTAQERQSQPPPQPPPAPRPAPPTPNRPKPPPRNDTRMPSEEEIRAGMNYRKPPGQFDGARSEDRQSAWSFQQSTGPKPDLNRSGTTRTPRKNGFDPNAPGSDERPARGSSYAHRHRSEDFGMPGSGAPFPPPPPGPPPQSPLSPTSPNGPTPGSQPYPDPLRAFRAREGQDQHVPFTEANRHRTPYSAGAGERTEFSSEGLRRSASTRDATKLQARDGDSRARSTSPLGRHKTTKGHQNGAAPKPPVDYSSSDSSDDDQQASQTENESTPGPGRRPQSAQQSDRPKRYPTPPSKRFNGSSTAFSPPSSSDGAQPGAEAAGMRQKTNNNMYASFPDMSVPISPYKSPFAVKDKKEEYYGLYPLHKPEEGNFIPRWTAPCSFVPINVKTQHAKRPAASGADTPGSAAPEPVVPSLKLPRRYPPLEQRAFHYVEQQLEHAYGPVPSNFDMDVFLKLLSIALTGDSSGNGVVDRIMQRAIELYSLDDLACKMKDTTADKRFYDTSFTLPINNDMFPPSTKSRSEEHINTKFSPDGWNGAFTGASEYFAPPPPQSNRKAPSPPRRGSQRSSLRSATTNIPNTSSSETDMPPPRRPFGSDGQGQSQQPETTPGEVKFSKEAWEKTFQDASWTWPPPPPKPTDPSKTTATSRPPGRKGSRSQSAQSTTTGTQSQPHVIDEDEDEVVAAPSNVGVSEGRAPTVDEPDAMDIDSTPPTQQSTGGTPTDTKDAKEARPYSVPPSTWRQQQQTNGQSRNGPQPSIGSGEAKLNTTLDDLAHVEPIARSADGLKNLADMSSTLPFESQAAGTLPSHPVEPHKLSIPSVPKAPEPPTKLTKQSWHAHAENFSLYLQAYHAFNKTMLAHFEARESQAQARMAGGFAWLEATGDTVSQGGGLPGGYGSYVQGVKEDEQVRETWNLGCERHMEACLAFEKIRERIKKMVAMGFPF